MDDRLDLSPLDPAADPVRFERLVSAAVTDAVRARAGRPVLPATLLDLNRWTGPLIAMAATIAIVASAALLALRPAAAAGESLAESAGIPRSLVDWAVRGEHPPVADLAAAFGVIDEPDRTAHER